MMSTLRVSTILKKKLPLEEQKKGQRKINVKEKKNMCGHLKERKKKRRKKSTNKKWWKNN